MGQYYIPLLIDNEGKILKLRSYDFNNGAKLTEHSWIGNEFVNAVLHLITDNPMKVVWMGDYSKDVEDTFAIRAGGIEKFRECYHKAWVKTKDYSESFIKREFFKGVDLYDILNMENASGYLINHTKRTFVDLKQYITANKFAWCNPEDVWCIHPLPLLTACGNGLGSGDYSGINEDILGCWAFSLIEFSYLRPANYKRVRYRFKEARL